MRLEKFQCISWPVLGRNSDNEEGNSLLITYLEVVSLPTDDMQPG